MSTSKILSFVGCFCGAKNSLYYLENTDGRGSYCPNCKRYQCLRCGEDFFKEYSYARHLDRNDHKNPNLAVTTEFANRPADFPCKAPKLEDAIKIFLCHVDCEGTAKDAYKVNQYLSKCTKCEAYKCLVCGFYEFTWNKLEVHFNSSHKKFDWMKPVNEIAIDCNKAINKAECIKCHVTGTAIHMQGMYTCKLCKFPVNELTHNHFMDQYLHIFIANRNNPEEESSDECWTFSETYNTWNLLAHASNSTYFMCRNLLLKQK